MYTTRSATSRLKPISWLTTIIVMPCEARSFMTLSTSPMSSGSSALVGSSNSISTGSIAMARAIATRCFWPPESWLGKKSMRSASPTLVSSVVRLLDGVVLLLALDEDGALGDVLGGVLVREEVELLEHHAALHADLVDVLLEGAAVAAAGDVHAADA